MRILHLTHSTRIGSLYTKKKKNNKRPTRKVRLTALNEFVYHRSEIECDTDSIKSDDYLHSA
jgi:hypothetical protein